MQEKQKVAIVDNDKVLAFLKAAWSPKDEIRTYPMLAFGMHPENLRRLNADNINGNETLTYKRAKNARIRREQLTAHVAKTLKTGIKKGWFKISNTAYQTICARQGNVAVNDYPTPPISPMTLRHTYALNELRRFDFDYDLVAHKMGCSVTTLKIHYLDLEQWERVHKQKHRQPLDLTHYEFMEG